MCGIFFAFWLDDLGRPIYSIEYALKHCIEALPNVKSESGPLIAV